MGYINNGFNVVYKSALFVLPARTDQDNTYTTAFTVTVYCYTQDHTVPLCIVLPNLFRNL